MRLLPKGKTNTAETTNRIVVGSIVEYEQHSQPMLAAVIADKRGKWGILNIKGAALDMPAARLYLLPGILPERLSTADKTAYLADLENKVQALVADTSLDELWSLVSAERSEISVTEVSELLFEDNSLIHHMAARRLLLNDQIFFKRGKVNFEPRPAEVVEELKVKAKVEAEKQRARNKLIDAVVARIAGKGVELPDTVEDLEAFAALGKSAEHGKETALLLDEIVERSGLEIREHGQERAFKVLVAAKHFHPDQNLSLLRLGRKLRFDSAAMREATEICTRVQSQLTLDGRLDLRALPAITIDNVHTKDLDDALTVEKRPNGFRIGIHIADVASLIAPGSALEREARIRATSIYTPDEHIPMLPPSLSEGALSLLAGVDRPAVTFFIEMSEEFKILRRDVQQTLIHVKNRLSYEEADAILCDEPGAPQNTELREHLQTLWGASTTSEMRRMSAGAMQFSRRELSPKINLDGTVTVEELVEDTPAHKLVGEMMILANETAALFAKEKSFPMIFRTQDAPDVVLEEVGQEIPSGPAREYYQRSFVKRSVVQTAPAPHSGVGVEAYLQITSPIRRSSDMLNQRQLCHFISQGRPLYERDGLDLLLASLEGGLDQANIVQRERIRYWLLRYLSQEKIKEIDATIIKVDGPKPLAELDIVYMIAPFHSLGDKNNQEWMKSRRGERIRLSIETIDPRRDAFVLREIAK